MDWKSLPSLSALRAFDALARHGSLSAAARALNVTHAAISQHLRALEAEFGETLAHREGQAMTLTPAGRDLAVALDAGFTEIADGVARLAERKGARPVSVTLTPTFAEAWLMPKISAFWAAHPDVAVSLSPSMALADLRRDGFDLAIRFGEGNWPGYLSEPLDISDFVLISSPRYSPARTLEELGDLNQHTWLASAMSAEQERWMRILGADYGNLNLREMPENGMVLSAVRAGAGLSVQAHSLVKNDLESGALLALHTGDALGLGYHIVTRDAPLTPNARLFRDWLRAAAR